MRNKKTWSLVLPFLLFHLVLSFVFAWRGAWLVAHSDHIDFLRTTHAFQSGELPESFKRSPLWPILLAGADTVGLPPLDWAQIMSAAFLALASVGVFAIASRWVRWPWAATLAILPALFPDTVAAGFGGLLDPFFLLVVVAWMWGAKEKKVWICLLAALFGGVLRHELFLLSFLTAFVWPKGWAWPARVATAFLSLLTAAPGLLWIALGTQMSKGLGYFQEVAELGNVAPTFLWTLFATPLRIAPGSVDWVKAVVLGRWDLSALAFAGLCLVVWAFIFRGVGVAWRKDRGWTALVLVWLAWYLVIHTFFAAAHFRYLGPVIPAFALFGALGASRWGVWGRALAPVLLLSVFLFPSQVSLNGVSPPGFAWLSVAILLVPLLALALRPRPSVVGSLLVCFTALLFTSSIRSLCATGGRLWAEVPEVAAWLRTNGSTEKKILIYHPSRSWLKRNGIPESWLVPEYSLNSPADLTKRKVAYAIWFPTAEVINRSPDQWQARSDATFYTNGVSRFSVLPQEPSSDWQLVALLGPPGTQAKIFRFAKKGIVKKR